MFKCSVNCIIFFTPDPLPHPYLFCVNTSLLHLLQKKKKKKKNRIIFTDSSCVFYKTSLGGTSFYSLSNQFLVSCSLQRWPRRDRRFFLWAVFGLFQFFHSWFNDKTPSGTTTISNFSSKSWPLGAATVEKSRGQGSALSSRWIKEMRGVEEMREEDGEWLKSSLAFVNQVGEETRETEHSPTWRQK
jgi:hypothetical protein